MLLKGKTILILSPQAWGKMFLSKHHYAVELARHGNRVYFLNPPDHSSDGIHIIPSDIPGLFIVSHSLSFPYWLKFKLRSVFHWLMKGHIDRILKKTGDADVIWSFDLGCLYPFRFFPRRALKIFHPVDEPLTADAIASAAGADIIISVTNEILAKYKSFGVPLHFVNHGVSEDFIRRQATIYKKNQPVRVGFSGNLLRVDIDRQILLRIIRENANCVFEFWGSYNLQQTNIGGKPDAGTAAFVAELQKIKNVVLHGPVSPDELAHAMQDMDLFLICYDVQRDQSKGTNYHKIIEYIGTGRVTVSNNITTYKGQPDLVQMISQRENNEALPALFAQVVGDLENMNSVWRCAQRVEFATANTYASQINRIGNLISDR